MSTVTPKVTVTLGSDRPGGIDIALAGLCTQRFEDFEVIFADGRYHQRHRQVLEAVKKSGLKQPFYHVPNHRYSGSIWGNPCAGYNTGFMLAAGEVVVMLMDYAYAPKDWLAEHVKFQRRAKIIMAPHEYRTLHSYMARGEADIVDFHERRNIDGRPPDTAIWDVLRQKERFDEISILAEPFTAERLTEFPRETSDAKCDIATGNSLDWHYFNTKNESFPLEAVLAANGMDENYDRGRGPGDPDLGLRLHRQGLETWNVREAIVHCLNPRRILPNLNIVIPEDRRLPPPWDHRWYIQDGYTYFQKTIDDSSVIRAPNRFDIREKKTEIWKWKEMSLEEEAIIPKIVIPDEEYY